nr:immunoglobulin light chain junction region [Macaca mulatta]
CNAYADSNVLF